MIWMTTFFSSDTTEVRRKRHNILKELKEKKCQPRDKGEIKTFSAESKVTEFIASRFALKELLNKIHQIEGKLRKKETWNNELFFPSGIL